MDRKCTALVGEALRPIAALSRSKDETEIRAAENRDAPWNGRMVVAPARICAVPLTHIQHQRAPVVVWGYAPWYSGDDGWYSGYGTPSLSSYDNWTYVAPSEQNPSDTNPPTDPNARPRGVGCTTQTYKVPSADDGGERAVNVVRCRRVAGAVT
jgi:hypothetical protein